MTEQRELPRYKCLKVVWALKIKFINPNNNSIIVEEEGYDPIQVDKAYITKHQPHVGGYFVIYKNGYQSFSPADASRMVMQKLINQNGITVRQLKELVKDLPEANDDGEEFEVWLESYGGLSNVCKNITPLNKRESGQDIILAMDDDAIEDRLLFSAIHVGTGVQTVFNNDKPVNEVLIFVDTLITRLEELKTQALLRELTK